MALVKDQKFRVGLVQMTCSTDPDENLAKAIDRTREAARQGAQIVCSEPLHSKKLHA